MSRLPQMPDEWIDRSRTLQFRFEGHDYAAFEGDAISSALWAAGVRTLGRSFKYHRPRGILSMANHDVNVMVQDGQTLNVRGDVVPVRAGMNLSAVNTWGGVRNDRARFLDKLSAFSSGWFLLQSVSQQALVSAVGANVPHHHRTWPT